MPTSPTETITAIRAAVKKRGDFPSMALAIGRITQVLKTDDVDDKELSQVVLGDFALTQKVLRLANSAMYAAFGSQVTTVTKAVYVLGTEAVGHLAMGAKLLENLDKAASSDMAKKELGAAVLTSAVARDIGARVSGRDSEEVAVASLLRNMGRMLVCFYLPESFQLIVARTEAGHSEEDAARSVTGLTFGEIAKEISATWSLPPEVGAYLEECPANAGPHRQWIESLTSYSRSYVEKVAAGASSSQLAELANSYAGAVGCDGAALSSYATDAFARVEEPEAKQAMKAVVPEIASLRERESLVAPLPKRSGAQLLLEGLLEAQGVENKLSIPQLTALMCEVAWKSLSCARAMFFLRKPALQTFELTLVAGRPVAPDLGKVLFDEAFSPDVFHLALGNRQPIFLNNPSDPSIARRIPTWFSRAFPDTRAMFLLPVNSPAKPAGLLLLCWEGVDAAPELTAAETTQLGVLKSMLERAFERAHNGVVARIKAPA